MKEDKDDSDEDYLTPSDLEPDDNELVEYLQSNTSFLLAMNSTGALSDSWRWVRFFQ